jgi:hypothetical protein
MTSTSSGEGFTGTSTRLAAASAAKVESAGGVEDHRAVSGAQAAGERGDVLAAFARLVHRHAAQGAFALAQARQRALRVGVDQGRVETGQTPVDGQATGDGAFAAAALEGGDGENDVLILHDVPPLCCPRNRFGDGGARTDPGDDQAGRHDIEKRARDFAHAVDRDKQNEGGIEGQSDVGAGQGAEADGDDAGTARRGQAPTKAPA